MPEIAGECPDIGRDGHLIVIEHHDEFGSAVSGVIHGLIAHAAGHGAVADHGNDGIILSCKVPCAGKAQGQGDGCGGMTCIEQVIFAFLSAREAADSAIGPEGIKLFAASGEQLVGIHLVPDIKDQLVLRKVQHLVEGDCHVHDAEI